MREASGHSREFRDGLTRGPVKGRGAGLNPGNRFESTRLHVLAEHLDQLVAERAEPAQSTAPDLALPQLAPTQLQTQFLPDATRSILVRVDVPDLHFHWTVNPYRGCEHGCIYCYARPGHEYLGLSCGVDFETRIFAKHDAPRLLREELMKPRWKGEPIMISGVTDPYQPIERDLRITRGLLQVCAEFRQPVSVITKNAMITRDIDILRDLARENLVHAALSITTLDNALASRMEPRASAPRERLRAVRELSRAGVPVTVMIAPVVPGLTDQEMPAILKAAHQAGAGNAGYILLRLPYQIKELFLDWLDRNYPEKAARVEGLVRGTRGGALYDSRMFIRQRGDGAFAAQLATLFKVFAKKYRLDGPRHALNTSSFRPPQGRPPAQLSLF